MAPRLASCGAAQATVSAVEPTFAPLVRIFPAALETVLRTKSTCEPFPAYLANKKDYALANIILDFAGPSASHRLIDCSYTIEHETVSLLVYLFWRKELDSSYCTSEEETENEGEDRQINDYTPVDTSRCGWLRQNAQGELYCFMCRKHATEEHLRSGSHLKRVEWYQKEWPEGYYPQWRVQQDTRVSWASSGHSIYATSEEHK